jgi:hypothetical protein
VPAGTADRVAGSRTAGAAETAHRTLQTCGQVCRYAVATGRAERDPIRDLRGALAPMQKGHHAAVTTPARRALVITPATPLMPPPASNRGG